MTTQNMKMKGCDKMEKIICFNCEKINDYEIRKVTRKYEGDGYSFEMEVEVPFCSKCGRELVSESIEEQIREKANAIIRKQRDIITQGEIIEILDKYSTSQKFLSRLLGWGEITLTRYVGGNYTPNQENSARLKSLSNPYVFQSILNEKCLDTHKEMQKEMSYKKAQAKVNDELIKLEKENSKIFSVIHWFLSQATEEFPITHLALEKLLYFVQSWSVALTGKWMFDDDCQAWVHGAVYPQVYEMFKGFGYQPLPRVNYEMELSEEDIKILNMVKLCYFDVYSAKTLEKVCHLEQPYQEARKGYLEEQACQEIIDKEQIKSYYERVKQKYNISLEDISGVKKYLNCILG